MKAAWSRAAASGWVSARGGGPAASGGGLPGGGDGRDGGGGRVDVARWVRWRAVLPWILAGGVAAGCGRGSRGADDAGSSEMAPVTVGVGFPERGSVKRFVASAGNLQAERRASLRAETGGRVIEAPYEEGDRVEAGAVVLAVEAEAARLQLERARLVAERDREELRRSETLFRKGLLSGDEFESVRTRARLSATDVEIAEDALRRSQVVAPFAGVLTRLDYRPGQFVPAGVTVGELLVLDPLLVEIHLPEEDVVELTPGQPVEVYPKVLGGRMVAGRIRRISPVVDAATGTVRVTVEVPNEEGALRPGAFVRVHVITELREGVLKVPVTAVLWEARRPFVFCVEGDSAVRKEITLGLEEGDFVEVVAGLADTERVVTAGQGALRPGDPVRVVEEMEGDSPEDGGRGRDEAAS